MRHLQGLVADKLKSFEREHKELHMLLFPEVGLSIGAGRGAVLACGLAGAPGAIQPRPFFQSTSSMPHLHA